MPRWTSGLGRLKLGAFSLEANSSVQNSLVTEEVGGSNPSRGALCNFHSLILSQTRMLTAIISSLLQVKDLTHPVFLCRVSSVGRAVIKKGSRPGTTQQFCSKSIISYGSVVRVHHAAQPPYNGTLLWTTI